MPKPEPSAVNTAHVDGNQNNSLIGVQGSAGTADTKGTALTLPIGVREDSGAMYVYNLGPAGNVTVAGTDPTSYLPARLTDGTNFYNASGGAGGGTFVNISTGTLNTIVAGTINKVGTIGVITNVGGGTIDSVNTGTIQISAGTIVGGTLGNLNSGTLLSSGTTTGVGVVTSVTNLASGTLLSSGTTTGVGVVSSLSLGTVTGDVASGVADLGNPVKVGGKYSATPPTLTDGNRGDLLLDQRGAAAIVVKSLNGAVFANVTTPADGQANTSNALFTVNRNQNYNGATWDMMRGDSTGVFVGNVVKGTITALASGTITAGTMTPGALGTSLTTVGTTGAAVWGTLVAASGAGTKQYVSGVDIVVTSGTVDVAVTNIGVGGSTGAGVLARGQFPAGGGISKNFNPIQASGTNGTLSYWLGGAGTVAVTIQYWNGV